MQRSRLGVVPGVAIVGFHGTGVDRLREHLPLEHKLIGITLRGTDALRDGGCRRHATLHWLARLLGHRGRIPNRPATAMTRCYRGRYENGFRVGRRPSGLVAIESPPYHGILHGRKLGRVGGAGALDTHITRRPIIGGRFQTGFFSVLNHTLRKAQRPFGSLETVEVFVYKQSHGMTV